MNRLFFTLMFLCVWNAPLRITEIDDNLNNKSFKIIPGTVKLENPMIIRLDMSNILNTESLASRNNNPGNLKSFRTGEFRVFTTLEEGYAALLYDLNLKITGRSVWTDSTTTIEEFINIYAPSFENDVKTYIKIFCSETGLLATDLLNTQHAELIARGIIKAENGTLYKNYFSKRLNFKI